MDDPSFQLIIIQNYDPIIQRQSLAMWQNHLNDHATFALYSLLQEERFYNKSTARSINFYLERLYHIYLCIDMP